MGKLNINFVSNGKDIFKDASLQGKIGKAQYFQRKYSFKKIQEIEVEKDITISLDIDYLQNEIDWEQFYDLTPEIIENLKEIEYYRSYKDSLNAIISELEHCRFEDRYKIEELGLKAIRIIGNIKESKFDKTLDSLKCTDLELSKLRYTVEQKEVHFLLKYIKNSDSLKRKNNAVNEAVHQLTFEIGMITTYLYDY
jgi:hypothetical protein